VRENVGKSDSVLFLARNVQYVGVKCVIQIEGEKERKREREREREREKMM
jgi:hypothetical protein